ncbi:MAG: sensor histidine kinase [Candidatus Peregrinibacteria bacterium]|nr:sensor histidine kinase [Candidatus Peregrinibacteria bacterium]
MVPEKDNTSDKLETLVSEIAPSTRVARTLATEMESLLSRANDGQNITREYINARVEVFLILFRPLLTELIERGSQEDIKRLRHDAGNMLTVIDSFFGDSANFTNAEAISDVKESLGRLGQLLLELPVGPSSSDSERSLQEVSSLVQTNLSQLVGTSSAILRGEDCSCRLKNEVPADSVLKVDPVRLSIAFDNIIRNAAEAGATEIRASAEALQLGEESFLQAGEYMLIRFRDNGPGIEQEKLGTVLQSGVSGHKEPGRGVGLASAKMTVEQQGGHLFIKSQTGEGSYTEINILLPGQNAELVEMPGVEPGSKDEV